MTATMDREFSPPGLTALARPWLLVATVMLSACQPATPPLVPSSPDRSTAVAPLPAQPATPRQPTPPSGAAPARPSAPVALPAMDLAPGPIYRCDVAGSRAILELPENIEALCRRHPEMGPCQYERDACRQRGGRVLTSKGDEVTLAVEAEYDKRVRRVRFQGDGVPKR